jgi:hypothetical protein
VVCVDSKPPRRLQLSDHAEKVALLLVLTQPEKHVAQLLHVMHLVRKLVQLKSRVRDVLLRVAGQLVGDQVERAQFHVHL